MRKLGAVVITAISVAGCASSPERIAPADVSEIPYLSWSCQQLDEESARLGAALATASEKQKKASENDALGVFLIALPVASMSGDDIEPEVARLKGEIEAVRRTSIKNNCAGIAASPGAAATPAASQDGAPAQ